MTVSILCLFFMVPWVGLQSVSVAFPDHTHLLVEVTAVVYEFPMIRLVLLFPINKCHFIISYFLPDL